MTLPEKPEPAARQDPAGQDPAETSCSPAGPAAAPGSSADRGGARRRLRGQGRAAPFQQRQHRRAQKRRRDPGHCREHPPRPGVPGRLHDHPRTAPGADRFAGRGRRVHRRPAGPAQTADAGTGGDRRRRASPRGLPTPPARPRTSTSRGSSPTPPTSWRWSISIAVRWPFAGLIFGFIRNEGLDWRKNPARVKAYQIGTWVIIAVLALRLLVQVPLYFMGEPGFAALATTRLLMGAPLYILGIWVAWLLTRPAPAAKTS